MCMPHPPQVTLAGRTGGLVADSRVRVVDGCRAFVTSLLSPSPKKPNVPSMRLLPSRGKARHVTQKSGKFRTRRHDLSLHRRGSLGRPLPLLRLLLRALSSSMARLASCFCRAASSFSLVFAARIPAFSRHSRRFFGHPPSERRHRRGGIAPVVSLVTDGSFRPARGVEELLPADAAKHLLRHGPRRRLNEPVPIVRRVVDYVFAECMKGDHALLLEGRGVDQGVEDGGHRADQPLLGLGGPVPRIRGLGLRWVIFVGWMRCQRSSLISGGFSRNRRRRVGPTSFWGDVGWTAAAAARAAAASAAAARAIRESRSTLSALLLAGVASRETAPVALTISPRRLSPRGESTSVLPLLERVLDSGFVRGLGAFPNQTPPQLKQSPCAEVPVDEANRHASTLGLRRSVRTRTGLDRDALSSRES